jgi:omega-amidase
MRAHLVQMDIAWHDRRANHQKVEKLLAEAEGGGPDAGDLVILPEMFDSGFSMDTVATADMAGETLAFILRLAEDLGVWIQGGRTVRRCVKAECRARNMAPVAGPSGELVLEYAKIHPFTFGREPEFFEGGGDVVTYRWGGGGRHGGGRHGGTEARRHEGGDGKDDGLTVCPAVCYDLRFPELFRIGLSKGAEAYAIGANWPEPRQAHWRALLFARAIENQAFVFGVNRTGSDPGLSYVGGSVAIGPRGEVLGELGPEEAVLSVAVDPGEVRGWREKFPAWRDGRLAPLAR